MQTEKQFGDLSQFVKRNVQLFKSSDQNETAFYFTEVDNKQRKTAKSFFELLRFELEGGDHQIYIRFPNTDYFIEMIGGGMGSAHGDMMIAEGKNICDINRCKGKFVIYSHGNNLLLSFGDFPRFNFMTKVASYDKGNPFNHPYPNKTFVNFKEIEAALSMKFLKIPESIRRIAYCCKTKDATPMYFLVDSSAYNPKYNNHRFFVIENEIVKEFVIKNFVVQRDGGTTTITVIDGNGIEHIFFSPTPLDKTLCGKWDKTALIETTEAEKQKLAELLKLDLEQSGWCTRII